jgi:H+/Cl- antiporter ClcA
MIQVIHYLLSLLYLLIAIVSMIKFARSWSKSNSVYTKFDNFLAFSLLVTLYLQLLMGVYLFYNKLSDPILMDNNSLEDRFWPIEHFFVMFFSILAAQLGYIYSKNLKNDNKIFRTLTIYYTISFVLVMFSLSMIFV